MREPGSARAFITAAASELGEVTLDAAVLASRHGTSEAAARRSLGEGVAHVTHRTALDLAEVAARRCLERAGLAGSDIDAIGWAGGQAEPTRTVLQLQGRLGALDAEVFNTSGDCNSALFALQMARGLLEGGARRVLVVSGEVWGAPDGDRTYGALSEDRYQEIFSDGAAAILVSSEPGLELLAFGGASSPAFWDVGLRYQRFRRGELDEAPNELEINAIKLDLHRLGLERCLRGAGLDAADVDDVLWTFDPPAARAFFVRHLKLPNAQLLGFPELAAHVGAGDALLGAEALLREGAVGSGRRVLLVARSVAGVRFALVRA